MSSFPKPPVRILITEGAANTSNFSSQKNEILTTVDLAVSAGLEMVQIREKQLPALLVYELVSAAVELTAGSETKLLVNERFDLALACGGDGVHLTSRSIPADRVRRFVPPEFLIGVSAHNAEDIRRARDSGADYAMLGPVFATPGKGDPLGLVELEAICREAGAFPVIAVGGVDASNSESVIEAGAVGYAAIRYLNEFVRIQK